ncbi:MAG: J domain-containing protein [Chloroflexi bacterium]|nr:J domain-containing protein [Chloroflexota bacterium]
MTDDPYAVLGVDRSATAEDVRRAYFRLVRQYPPEAHPEEFKRIRTAYETLRSPLRRAELALLAFDETVAEVDLDLIARLAGGRDFDAAAVWLAVELSASELSRTDFSEDLTPIKEDELLGA